MNQKFIRKMKAFDRKLAEEPVDNTIKNEHDFRKWLMKDDESTTPQLK